MHALLVGLEQRRHVPAEKSQLSGAQGECFSEGVVRGGDLWNCEILEEGVWSRDG